MPPEWTVTIMYRVIVVACCGVILAACSSTPDWMPEMPSLTDSKMFSADAWSVNAGPVAETVRFETTPPGAEAKASTGQSCRTPCALALPGDGAVTMTFTLAGYYPVSEKIDKFDMGDGTTALRPNPVQIELTQAPPPPAPKKKRRVRRKVAKPKPAPAPKPAAAAPAPQSSSPWPTPR